MLGDAGCGAGSDAGRMTNAIRVDLRPAITALGDLSARQVPFASALALTTLAQGVQDAETVEELKTFDSPTPFTQRAFAKTPATKRNLVATVFIKDVQAQYLAPYVLGGPRFLGTKKGMLAPRGVGLNKYGNLTKGKLASLKAKPNVFIGPVTFKNGTTINGVWQRGATPRGKRTKGDGEYGTKGKHHVVAGNRTTLKLLIQFEDTTEAPKHFDFYGAARAYVAKHGQRVFNEALAKALAMPRR